MPNPEPDSTRSFANKLKSFFVQVGDRAHGSSAGHFPESEG